MIAICTRAHSLTYSLTYSLTHSLIYLLTHSLSYLLTTHSLTHSLNHSLTYLRTRSLKNYLLNCLLAHLLAQLLTFVIFMLLISHQLYVFILSFIHKLALYRKMDKDSGSKTLHSQLKASLRNASQQQRKRNLSSSCRFINELLIGMVPTTVPGYF